MKSVQKLLSYHGYIMKCAITLLAELRLPFLIVFSSLLLSPFLFLKLFNPFFFKILIQYRVTEIKACMFNPFQRDGAS